MTYVRGQSVKAADLNAFINSVNNNWNVGSGDRGYGQGTTIPTVATGKVITAADWPSPMLTELTTMGSHQGTSTTLLPSAAAFATGLRVIAEASAAPSNLAVDLGTVVSAIDAARLTAAGGSVTTFAGKYSNSRSTAWGTVALSSQTITSSFSITFPSGDAARYFFNSGGQIHLSCARSGGTASTINTDWTNFLSGIGIVSIGAHATTRSGTVGPASTALGYYDLTAVDQIFFNANSGFTSPYTQNAVQIKAHSNGVQGVNADKGSVITLSWANENLHVSTTPTNDNVDGTMTLTVDEVRATTFLTITGPTYAIGTGF